MTLRRRLILLLCAFAGFAALAAGATIYGVQWQVQRAVRNFEAAVDHTTQLERLRVALKEQLVLLRELVEGRQQAAAPYFALRDEFLTKLRQVARFTETDPADERRRLFSLAEHLERTSDRCLAAIQAGNAEEARAIIAGELEGAAIPTIESQLRRLKAEQEEGRGRAVTQVGATSGQILALTVVVGILGACLVVLGASLIRRWLIVPVGKLHAATERFSAGDLEHRVRLDDRDELGRLGGALNAMAGSLAEAHADLRASERKHRMLFRNLHDAVVLCDREGRIQEYHDGETQLLGFEGSEQVGRHVLEAWPTWTAATADWQAVIEAVVDKGKRFRAVDVAVRGPKENEPEVFADFVAYRVEYSPSARYAAIVVRDVTERHRLQQRVRQAETLEAVGTLGSGLAHDFNNLLTSVIGTLSLLSSEVQQSSHADRIRGALRACWQAAGLSRRLLNFAGTAHGDPHMFRVHDELQLILNSLDPSFLEGVELETDLDQTAAVRMDRDQFTQIVLNLLRNARDAMPSGGLLRIRAESQMAREPEDGRAERPYAVLIVQDTGSGMPADVQRRIFEPFFTTKSRATRRGRGMGLAIVYSIVRNANGFLRIESEVGVGTTFRVFLPAAEGVPEPPPAPEAAVTPRGTGRILLVNEDPMIRDVCRDALTQWGYEVVAVANADEATTSTGTNGAVGCSLAIIDTHSPERTGVALAEHLVALDPALRIILTSGAEELELPPALARQVYGRLTKPFRLEALASAVSGALVRSHGPEGSQA